MSIPIWLGIKENEVCLDLYGFHNLEKSFILSTRHLPYKVIKSFPLFMRPLELNIKYGLTGDGIYLYDTSLPSKGDMRYSREIAPYYMRGFCFRPLFHYVLNKAVERVKKKFL